MAQNFQILRSTGVWQTGTWVTTVTTIQGYGVIEVADPRTVEMTSAADVIKEAITIWCTQPLFATHNGTGPGSSDIIVYHGFQWRILRDANWSDYGYFRATAIILQAA